MVIQPETEPNVVIRYLNQSGALVEVTGSPGYYNARCSACLDAALTDTALRSPRAWAATHAEACRALPQPEPNQQ
jgi:hypothetical protein